MFCFSRLGTLRSCSQETASHPPPVPGPIVAEVLLAGEHRVLVPTKAAFFFSLFCRGGPRVVPVVKGSRLSVPFSSLRSCLCRVGTPRSCSQETASHSPPASWSHRGGGLARRRPPGARTDRSGWLVYCRSPRWQSAPRSLVSPGSRDLHFHFLFFLGLGKLPPSVMGTLTPLASLSNFSFSLC